MCFKTLLRRTRIELNNEACIPLLITKKRKEKKKGKKIENKCHVIHDLKKREKSTLWHKNQNI